MCIMRKNRKSPTTREIAEATEMSKSNVYRYLVDMSDNGMIDYENKEIITKKITKVSLNNINVALVGEIACGSPIFAEENIEEYFSLPESLVGKGKFFILRAKGKSMIKAGIDSGDLVLIRQQNYANNGEIVVTLCEGNESTLKRFYKQKNHIRLHPENDGMEDIFVDDCVIQGVAIKVLKDL